MSHLKKILFSVFVILAITIGAWAYLNLKNSKKPNVDAVSVLPDNCLVYLNTNNFFELNKKINSQSLIADKLKLFGEVNLLCNTLNAFDSVFTLNSALEEMVNKNSIHFALYEKDLSWLVTFNIKRLGNQELILTELGKVLHAKNTQKDVYEFKLNSGTKFFYSLQDGVTIISNSIEAIELCLSKSTPKILANKQFLEFKNTLEENSLISIYINHQLYSKSKAVLKLNLSTFNKGGYSAGSINIEPSQLTINGYLKPKDSELMYVFYDQEPQEADFINLLPNNTHSFIGYGFSSFEKLLKTLNKEKELNNLAYWKIISDSAMFNIENEFYQNIENYLVSFQPKLQEERYTLLKVKDTLKTIEHLGFMSDSLFTVDSIKIYRLKTKNLKTPLKLFNFFINHSTEYSAIFNSHILFSETKSGLVSLLNNLKTGATLMQNESFMVYKNQNLSENFNYMAYNSPDKNEIQSVFNFALNTQSNPFENFKHFSFLVSNNASNFNFRMQLMNEAQTVNKEQNVLWTMKMDAQSDMQANSFLNHITKENEIVIQDNEKNLYLINAKGTVLWKKKLNEKISSKVYTVDIFKNNKYQLLFSSLNYLHLIDRNGNYVQGYPVKLPDESTSELSLIDYDNDKDYRLFIACKNKTIYNYSIFGVKQDKFVSVKTEGEINLPIQYVKVGLSDYLVAIDKGGKIYTFSRKGEGRIGLKNKTIENCSAFYVDATNNINSTYLIYVDDKNSLLNKISFSDKKVVEKLNVNIDSASVTFSQADENKTTGVILTKSNSILVYNLNGNLLFEKTIDNKLSETFFSADESQPIFLSFSKPNQELILLDKIKLKIKLFKSSALPLITDLFNTNKKYLIVTEGNQVNCVAL